MLDTLSSHKHDQSLQVYFLPPPRTQALDEGASLEMLPERLRTEIAIHVHLDTLRKVLVMPWVVNVLNPCISVYVLHADHTLVL